MDKKKEFALKRANELKNRIKDYSQIKKTITVGLDYQDKINERKENILDILNAKESNWNSYIWQLKNRIDNADTLSKFIDLSSEEIKQIKKVEKQFRWAISPYYLSLINPTNILDPIKLISIPTYLELEDPNNELDPMREEYNNPAGAITRRYPDRLIINVTNECAMYCRYCQRRRNIGQKDKITSESLLKESIDYIKDNEEIRDVLLTGGDPLTISDNKLEKLIKEIYDIPHVEMIRIGTRTIVTVPQRITDRLCNMLEKYHPLYINTHFNHPMEITQESKKAADKLNNSGIPLGNQAVLLNGINNDKNIMKCLNQTLLKIRIKPYYLFHCKNIKGTRHFNTSINEGLEIMEDLRGSTSGLAIPTYIINAPKGSGKTPLLPQYILSQKKGEITLRTWENKIMKVENKPSLNLKELLNRKYK